MNTSSEGKFHPKHAVLAGHTSMVKEPLREFTASF